jgi:photosystem II stability/assembly factor-like uncharacterized protein
MPRLSIFFLLFLGLVSCETSTRELPAPTLNSTAITTLSQVPSPSATSYRSTPRPVATLPIGQILFRPGDLPDGFHVGRLNREIDDFVRYKLQAADVGAFVRLELDQNAKSLGTVTAYFYDDPTKLKHLYRALIVWASALGAQNLPQPNIGAEATLLVPNYDQAPYALIFRACRAAIQIDLKPPSRDERIILLYAQRIALRLDAVDCRGASSVPPLTPPPPLPTLTPSPRVAISQTIQAHVERLPDSDGEDTIRAYAFSDATHGWLALGVKIFATSDGGKTWRERFTLDSHVKDIGFLSPQVGWIEMQNGFLVTRDDGATWQRANTKPDDLKMPPPTTVQGSVNGGTYKFCADNTPDAGSFFALDRQIAWALCTSGAGAHFMLGVRLFQTTDGGKHWQLLNEKVPHGTWGGMELFFLDRQHGWIMTDSGLFGTDDGGRSWQTITSGDGGEPFNQKLRFVSLKQGFVIANPYNALLRTDDGGVTWHKIFDAPPTLWSLGPAQFFANGTGVAAGAGPNYVPYSSSGGVILQTTDAGKTWTQVAKLKGLCSGGFAVSVSALSFTDPQHGWATIPCGGQPEPLYRTQDGGKTWQALPTRGLADDAPAGVSFVDSQTGYVVTLSGRLFRSDDGGVAFAPVDNVAIHTPNLRFATKDQGWELRGTQLFETLDGGRDWQPLDLGYPIQDFSLLADGHAWVIIGDTTSLANRNPPRRVLSTPDRGQTWIEYQLGDILGKWRNPELDYVQFADALHGWLKAGAALYYTADGGQTWIQFH